jgi:hypothetical protein
MNQSLHDFSVLILNCAIEENTKEIRNKTDHGRRLEQ